MLSWSDLEGFRAVTKVNVSKYAHRRIHPQKRTPIQYLYTYIYLHLLSDVSHVSASGCHLHLHPTASPSQVTVDAFTKSTTPTTTSPPAQKSRPHFPGRRRYSFSDQPRKFPLPEEASLLRHHHQFPTPKDIETNRNHGQERCAFPSPGMTPSRKLLAETPSTAANRSTSLPSANDAALQPRLV